MSITPLDSIRRAIARHNGVADHTVSGGGVHGQGGRIENGLFPASHTAEELARIQELSQRNAGGPDSGQATRRRRERDREPGPIRRMVDAWWNRLLSAVYGGGFSTQEAEYEKHATRRDYLWNTLGTAVWGMAFPLLTIVSTQLVGAEEAGKFSIAFVTGTLIMIACNYGVRNFQVSDIDEKTSFASYQLNRWLCGALALACGLAYSSARGYDAQMSMIGLGVYLYKVIDGVADVYEGRLQQADKLYLAGMSQTLRSAGVIAVFSLALFLTRGDAHRGHGHGRRRDRLAHAGHRPARPARDRKIASREPARGRPPVCPVRPALWRAVPVQPDREHAQVCDGRRAGLQIPAVL